MKSAIPIISDIESTSKQLFYQQLEKPYEQQIKDFENAIGKYIGTSHVLAVNSGTAAIHLALRLLNIGKDDVVLCANSTFVASANPILYLGAQPWLVDCEKNSWNIDPDLLRAAIEAAISRHKKPKALVVVHLYGMPAHMEPIMEICHHYQIPVIEDAAHALGSRYQQRSVATFGDFGAFSFNNNKIVTGLGGGVLVCKNKTLVDQGKYLATQAKAKKPYYHHYDLGFNYRISPLNASMAYAQLPNLPVQLDDIRRTREYIAEKSQEVSYLRLQTGGLSAHSNYWRLALQLLDLSETQLEIIQRNLQSQGITCYRAMQPLNRMPLYQKYPGTFTGTGQELFERGIIFPGNLTTDSVDHILQALDSYY